MDQDTAEGLCRFGTPRARRWIRDARLYRARSPKTDSEKDATRGVEETLDFRPCLASHRFVGEDGGTIVYCTRTDDHRGRHAAGGTGETVVADWRGFRDGTRHTESMVQRRDRR